MWSVNGSRNKKSYSKRPAYWQKGGCRLLYDSVEELEVNGFVCAGKRLHDETHDDETLLK